MRSRFITHRSRGRRDASSRGFFFTEKHFLFVYTIQKKKGKRLSRLLRQPRAISRALEI